MGSSGGPHGVSLVYENVEVAITSDKITVTVNRGGEAEKTVVINQRTGEVEPS